MYLIFQASPSDPENFPFVVLGNKIDVDGGNSRVVSLLPNCMIGLLHTANKVLFDSLLSFFFCRFLRRKQRHGVLPRGTYHTLRPLQRRDLMLKLLLSV